MSKVKEKTDNSNVTLNVDSNVDPKVTLKDSETIEELTNTLKRVQADFENYKKRVQKEKEQFMQFATTEFIRKILPIVDNLDLAFRNEQSPEDFKKGIELIYAQIKDILSNQGVEEIEETNIFNPHLHQAMMTVNEDKEDNEIVEVFQKGYKLGDNVVRHAKVKVNKVEKIKQPEEQNDRK
jgi:molecular chaperone GrpE